MAGAGAVGGGGGGGGNSIEVAAATDRLVAGGSPSCSDHTVLLPVSRPWLSALLGDACVPAARPQSSLYKVTRWGEGNSSGSSC